MPNTAEYKNYLFVTVPLDASGQIDLVGTVGTMELKFIITKITNGKPSFHNKYIFLPPGSWQIIGKGDAIDWEGIVEKIASQNKYSGYPIGNWYMDYERKKPALFKTATESGHSLLKSLGMEPGTTLVLKKNEK